MQPDEKDVEELLREGPECTAVTYMSGEAWVSARSPVYNHIDVFGAPFSSVSIARDFYSINGRKILARRRNFVYNFDASTAKGRCCVAHRSS